MVEFLAINSFELRYVYYFWDVMLLHTLYTTIYYKPSIYMHGKTKILYDSLHYGSLKPNTMSLRYSCI